MASPESKKKIINCMLDAYSLVKKNAKPTSLPDFGGQKLFGIETSEEERHRLNSALEQFKNVVKEERISYKHSLSVADWDLTENIAVVDIKRGNNLQKYGFQTREGIFLNPEEALFLVDQGILELRHDGLPLSVQETYILIVPLLSSFEYYEVYSYLCRLGYIVRRYKKKEKKEDVDEEEEIVQKEENIDNEESIEPMASGYVKNLWCSEPDERPCIRPSEAKSTASVLTKLQVLELLKLKNITYDDERPLKHRIDFDIYLSSSLKKLGKPRFRVAVCKYGDTPPSLYEMGCLTNETDGVSLKLAVVNDGTISFYGMFGVDLPTLITVG